MKPKVLVTGGLGFIGSHLANRLAQLGYNVRVADIKDRSECYLPLHPKIEIYDHCDLRDFHNVVEAMHGVKQVWGLAAYMGGIAFITTHFADIIYNSTMINLNTAEACKLLGIKKVFFSSSACVYPEEKQLTPDNKGLKESDAFPANPDTCFIPNTKIMMGDGSFKDIQDVTVGEDVISGVGTKKKVTKIFNRTFDGELTKISFRMSNLPLICTPNHPFLVAKRVTPHSINKGGKWTHSNRSFENPSWVIAKNIKKGDALLIPILTECSPLTDVVHYYNDDGFLKLAGIYVAEGSCDQKYYYDKTYLKRYKNGKRVALWFGDDNKTLMFQIKEYLASCGVKAHIFAHKQTKKICGLEFASNKFAEILGKEFGRYAINKKIPNWLFYMPLNKQKTFLDAYLSGDGSFFKTDDKRKRVSATTISPILARQLFMLFCRQRKRPFIYKCKISAMKRPNKLVNGRIIEAKHDIYHVGYNICGKHTKNSEWANWIQDGYYYVVVKDAEKTCYTGTVCNLEVETDNSYTVECGIVAHNCYGWEKVFAEKMYSAFKQDAKLQIRIARFHNIYGEFTTYKDGREKAPAALCRKVAVAKDGDSVEIWGDGRQTRTFLYITDCVDAILKLWDSDCEEPLNIGSDRLISVDDLAKMIIKISGKSLKLTHNLNAPVGVEGRCSDNAKIKAVLGWEPKVPYEVGLKRLYDWVSLMVKREG